MKDQFYIVLPCSSSSRYFADNTTTHFITQLPQAVRLQGEWNVALTEIQIPLTFQHIPIEREERLVHVTRVPQTILITNKVRAQDSVDTESVIRPGIYKSIENLIDEINNLDCMRNHLKIDIECGGYVTITRLCMQSTCSEFDHTIHLSKRLKKILGLKIQNENDVISVNTIEPIVGERPANLSNSLPTMLMIYTDICEPYITGDIQARLLRVVSLNVDDYTYGSTRIKSFSPPMYLPLLFNSFQTIEIDIRDQQGLPIPFDYGTLTVTLHFKQVE